MSNPFLLSWKGWIILDVNQLAIQLNNLIETVKLIDSNVKFNIQMQWAVFAFVIASTGAALYFLAKSWFHTVMETKEKEIYERLRKDLTDKTSGMLVCVSGFYHGNGTEGRRISVGLKPVICIITNYNNQTDIVSDFFDTGFIVSGQGNKIFNANGVVYDYKLIGTIAQ